MDPGLRRDGKGIEGSISRFLDEDRRDPGGRRALDPFAAAALGIALAAARLGLAGSRTLICALAAQFFDAGADRLEIIGSSRAIHQTSLTSIGQSSAGGIVKRKPAGRQ